MTRMNVDLMIVGAGPVGLMCAYLAELCRLSFVVIDKTDAPLEVGRADALNARTLQLLEVANLFKELYPHGKPCNTSSVWSDGKFLSRDSSWWDKLDGCLHKHFLMLGQSYIEQLLDKKLADLDKGVIRSVSIIEIEMNSSSCLSILSNGQQVNSKYIIGADGSRSFVRNHFNIPFEIERPQIVWVVIDGIIDSDFEKVPEIIVFQNETSDVAWIPREGEIDRFYIRMDKKDFTLDEAVAKINKAMTPHTLRFEEVVWFSQFSVKESVAEKFSIENRVFLAGDACHIHSVNGGQGLNTGLADAFNLIWKINMVENYRGSRNLLLSYEEERKPVARDVVESSGELVRATKYSETGTHALDYVKIVEKRAGNITGMGIRYGEEGLVGSRLYDFEVLYQGKTTRLYSLLDYSKFTLFTFGKEGPGIALPDHVQSIHISAPDSVYAEMSILVRPDAYIEKCEIVNESISFD